MQEKNYELKYIKYKAKYLELKNLIDNSIGGTPPGKLIKVEEQIKEARKKFNDLPEEEKEKILRNQQIKEENMRREREINEKEEYEHLIFKINESTKKAKQLYASYYSVHKCSLIDFNNCRIFNDTINKLSRSSTYLRYIIGNYSENVRRKILNSQEYKDYQSEVDKYLDEIKAQQKKCMCIKGL